MKADYHLHTNFSDDSKYPMEDLVKRAINLGLDEICFTEHVDYGMKIDVNLNIPEYPERNTTMENCNYKNYISEFNRCRDTYQDKITLKFGIEFGVQTHTIEKFKNDAQKYDFDFIICSCHQVENKGFWIYEFQEGRTQDEYNQRYYQEILDVVKNYSDYSVLGHLDMIKRYDKVGLYPFEKVKGIITEILTTVIDNGKGIEVNTSSFKYGLPDLMPSREILSLYRELGGKIITIGSDSHDEKHVADKIDFVREELKKLNYTQFCTFDKRKAIFHDL